MATTLRPPIIYVRGFAMRGADIDETAADPFCGFNTGSTVYRAVENREAKPRKFVFESPVVRLMSDFGYRDFYEDGNDILDPEWKSGDGEPGIGYSAIIIHRYYDAVSALLGDGSKPDMGEFAKGLSRLIARVRELVVLRPGNNVSNDTFRCILVAHSMGGLVCRAFLQDRNNDVSHVARHVDKFFTYATPHNGIDVGGINVPSWLSFHSIDTFNREHMRDYLNLKDAYRRHGRVDLIPATALPASRVFCMVGTNRNDYEAAVGMSRTFVGHGSDGLVRIENATLCELKEDGSVGEPCAKAYAFRSHSGFFGIVNSEEAYQNLARFLFGDVRVDLWIDIEDIRLPQALVDAEKKGKLVGGLYQIELLAAPRGKLWYLTRRIAEEDSVACFTHADWMKTRPKPLPLPNHVSTVFLSKRAKVSPEPGLSYAMTLGIRYPDFDIDGVLWTKEHYEGGYLFRNALIVEIVPPQQGTKWQVRYGWQGTGASSAKTSVVEFDRMPEGGIPIPFESRIADGDTLVPSTPGVRGTVRLMVSPWQ